MFEDLQKVAISVGSNNVRHAGAHVPLLQTIVAMTSSAHYRVQGLEALSKSVKRQITSFVILSETEPAKSASRKEDFQRIVENGVRHLQRVLISCCSHDL